MRAASLVLASGFFAATLASGGCGSQTGDPPSDLGIPAAGGKDKTIKQVTDPGVANHADNTKSPQAVSGAVVITVDKFDETGNGKSTGTVYVQDIGSTDPYSGISLFAPTFSPGNLSVGPGDVLDLNGTYQENTTIGATVTFATGSVLPQISKPTATFRYEGAVPEPKDIDVADLADFTKGRRWLGMLVRIKNVTLLADGTADSNGRVSVPLNVIPGAGTKCNSAFPKPASLINALFDMAALNYTTGTKFSSITGVVGFFCNIQLAPRSKDDLVKAP